MMSIGASFFFLFQTFCYFPKFCKWLFNQNTPLSWYKLLMSGISYILGYPDINYSDDWDIRGEEGHPQHFRMRAKFSLLFWFTKIHYFIYVLTREMLKICLSSKKKMERIRISKWLGGENEVNVAWTRHCCGLPSSPRYQNDIPLKIQKSNKSV